MRVSRIADLVLWVGLLIAMWIGPVIMVKITVTMLVIYSLCQTEMLVNKLRTKIREWDD